MALVWKSFQPPESQVSGQVQTEKEMCLAAAGTVCPARHAFQWPLCPQVFETCLIRQAGWHRLSAPTPV